MTKRYCGMCDEWVKGRECPKCGADTDKADPEPKELPKVVDLMGALRKALDNWPKPPCRMCGGSGFVAEKRSIGDGYGEVDGCPACDPDRADAGGQAE